MFGYHHSYKLADWPSGWIYLGILLGYSGAQEIPHVMLVWAIMTTFIEHAVSNPRKYSIIRPPPPSTD
jgi:hypothetical protein